LWAEHAALTVRSIPDEEAFASPFTCQATSPPINDRALERVRGGNQVPSVPTSVTAMDDWEAPVV